MKVKVYICHYPPLSDRKAYLDTVLPTLGIPFQFFNSFNRDNISNYKHFFTDDIKTLQSKGWNSTPPNMSPSIKATTLEHLKIYENIYFSNDDYSIVLEDDAILVKNFKERILKLISVLPPDWDIVHFSKGCEGRPQIQCNDNTNLVKMESRNSWTASGYLIKKNTARLLHKNMLPIALPIDFELNYIQNLLKMNVYWAADPLVYEGSNPAAGEYYKYVTSQIR